MGVMARPKSFDQDAALQSAITVFADHGYEGASTDALLQGMGISRQSLYDTFGDKRRLYLEALGRYNADSVAEIIEALNAAPSPLQGIEAALLAFAGRPAGQGCLGVGAVCEFGDSDPEVARLTQTSGRALQAAFQRRLEQAATAGEINADIVPRAAADFLSATLSGLKVSARGGASPAVLRDIARMAIRSLH